MEQILIKISDAAKMLGVTKLTLQRWDKKGKLKPVRTAGMHRRYRITDIEAFLNRDTNPTEGQ